MTDNHKLLDHTSVGKLTVNELFETGQTTLASKDKKTIHRFLEIGHFPIVKYKGKAPEAIFLKFGHSL